MSKVVRALTRSAHDQQAGFSLVEVSLALLVVGIGILSAFSLFPAGMEMGKDSLDDSRLAIFADEVFNGYRAIIENSQSEWDNLSTLELPAVTFGMWKEDGQNMGVEANTSIEVVKAQQWDNDQVEYAIRYTLEFKDVGTRIKSATLKTWSGEFGTTNNPRVFYTEFYNYGIRP